MVTEMKMEIQNNGLLDCSYLTMIVDLNNYRSSTIRRTDCPMPLSFISHAINGRISSVATDGSAYIGNLHLDMKPTCAGTCGFHNSTSDDTCTSEVTVEVAPAAGTLARTQASAHNDTCCRCIRFSIAPTYKKWDMRVTLTANTQSEVP